MSWHQDPDRALARWLTEEDQRYEQQLRADRIGDYTPAAQAGKHRASEGVRVTSAMSALAWTHLNGSWSDARDAGRVLAELVLEAGS